MENIHTLTDYPELNSLFLIKWAFNGSFKIDKLKAAGIITVSADGRHKWNLSKSSLVDYVKHITRRRKRNWHILEKVFNFNPGTLRRLASTNGNIYKLDNPDKPSKDFKKVIEAIGES